MDPQRFDGMLMEILQDRKTIAGFLDAIFGFLSRNTDFYYEQKNKDDKIGFPSGMKEQIVMKVLQKFDPKYRYVTDSMEVSPAITEVEVTTTEELPMQTDSEIKEASGSKSEIPKDSNKKELFSTNEFHNGARFDSYCWSQTSTEIELHICLPEGIKSSKHIGIQIEPNHIKVISKLDPGSVPLFDGVLSAKCKHNDALWTISEGKLQITLDKMKEAWWDRLVDGEPAIDVSKIDCTKYMDELPPDSQAAIEKLRWEQQQKEAGIPTEAERNNLQRLREAWDAEGSPFKGQPFDPSMVKFN
ncbi:nudC domain-containing protein 3 [Episyrphus balteatus]|uniref:nudC domain-containing protein 3 n=1 Tax=Episyrphus balteatus TaxID=286459 RepID=UPI002484FF47|nr:nudC domain-containing protein 3 [Episyrphus balteatus]